jgi:hypothetical protein
MRASTECVPSAGDFCENRHLRTRALQQRL